MTDERTIHLTKKEFDDIILKTRSEGYDRGYENGYKDCQRMMSEKIA